MSSCSPSLCTPMSMAASLCELVSSLSVPGKGNPVLLGPSISVTPEFCLFPLDKGKLPRLEGRTYILREEFETTEWIVCIFLSGHLPLLPLPSLLMELPFSSASKHML